MQKKRIRTHLKEFLITERNVLRYFYASMYTRYLGNMHQKQDSSFSHNPQMFVLNFNWIGYFLRSPHTQKQIEIQTPKTFRLQSLTFRQ